MPGSCADWWKLKTRYVANFTDTLTVVCNFFCLPTVLRGIYRPHYKIFSMKPRQNEMFPPYKDSIVQ